MKIESRGISITGVPRVRSIIAESGAVSIEFEYSESIWTWTFPELREFHAAIGEALKHDPEAPVAPVKPEKTEWVQGDPEPEGVTEVIDCDDDLWRRVNGKWGMPNDRTCPGRRWDHLLEDWGPVRLPEDEK